MKKVHYNKKMIGLQIQTISSCNSRCIICPHAMSWTRKRLGVMTDELFDKVIKEISVIKFKKICPYLMNEPLTDPKIF